MSTIDFYEILKFLIPQIAMLVLVYMFLESWMRRENVRSFHSRKDEFNKHILPNQIHAFERMVLYLERISPNNSIPRLNQQGLTAKEFQYILTKEISDEFDHNLSQQLYIPNEAWKLITLAKDKMIQDIMHSTQSLPENASSKDLAYKIIENHMSAKGKDLCVEGIKMLKVELYKIIQ